MMISDPSPRLALLEVTFEAAKEHVGRTQLIPLGALQARDLQRFAIAVGAPEPEFLDESAARAAGYDGLPAMPGYLSAVLGWQAGPVEGDLYADGNAAGPLGNVPVGGLQLMGGGQALRFGDPVLAGAVVTMELTVDDVQLKHGNSGPLLLLVVLRRYVDQADRLLVECRETFIAR